MRALGLVFCTRAKERKKKKAGVGSKEGESGACPSTGAPPPGSECPEGGGGGAATPSHPRCICFFSPKKDTTPWCRAAWDVVIGRAASFSLPPLNSVWRLAALRFGALKQRLSSGHWPLPSSRETCLQNRPLPKGGRNKEEKKKRLARRHPQCRHQPDEPRAGRAQKASVSTCPPPGLCPTDEGTPTLRVGQAAQESLARQGVSLA